MIQEARGLAYFSGLDGDFKGSARSVVWMPAVLTVPREVPFLIETISVGEYASAGGASAPKGGGSVRDPKPTVLSLTRRPSEHSTQLLRRATTGLHFENVIIHGAIQSGKQQAVELVLDDVVITSFKLGVVPAPSTDAPEETISLNFRILKQRVFD